MAVQSQEISQEVMSTRAASARLGVALRTVQLWVEQGSLQAWKTVGGHRRVLVSSVERMMADRQARLQNSNPDHPLRLLVVEDDARLRRLYELDVPSWSPPVQLELAKDGFEGLLKVGTFRPEVIITDLMMPGMDGFGMIAALRNDPSVTARIIVVTALDAGTIRDRGGLPSDLLVLRKPAGLAELRALVMEPGLPARTAN
jgi:excisionase family DNA binding protein